MLLELETALRFLRPQKSQFARTLIALSSLGVVSIVTWLVLVFYSVTEGLEKRWIDQLVQVTGSVRVFPTYSYFDHPDFLIDSYCETSGFQPTLLTEKIKDPHLETDLSCEILPDYLIQVKDPSWTRPSYKVWNLLENLQPLSGPVVALSARAQFDVLQFREKFASVSRKLPFAAAGTYRLQQSGSIMGFYPKSTCLQRLLQPLETDDWNGLMLSLGQPALQKPWPLLEKHLNESPILEASWNQEEIPLWPVEKISAEFIEQATWIQASDWQIIEVKNASWNTQHQRWMHLATLQKTGSNRLQVWIPAGFLTLKKVQSSIWNLEAKEESETTWMPLLAPKILKDAGLQAGSLITLEKEIVGPLGRTSYEKEGLVVGFYDSGIMPLGGRFLMTSYEQLLPWIDPSEQDPETQFFQAWPKDPLKSAQILREQLAKEGLGSFFEVRSYEDFDASHDLIMQLRSDRLLLSLIAFIILIVASSSVCTMMLLLVNERRKEIAVLKTLGMSSSRLCSCFALSGLILGALGALIGISLAWITLNHLDTLIGCISYLQGGPLLNPAYYGKTLPTSMSFQAIKLALLGNITFTLLGSSLAAWQTSRMNPPELFRSL